jgi:hypothetical protein
MKICRYQLAPDGPIKLGVVRGDMVHDVTAATDALPSVRWPYPAGDQVIANLDALRPAMEAIADSAEPLPLASVLLKNPVGNPGKFICGVGNYDDVLKAGGHPRRLGLLFKMTSAAAGESDGVAASVIFRSRIWSNGLCSMSSGKAARKASTNAARAHLRA